MQLSDFNILKANTVNNLHMQSTHETFNQLVHMSMFVCVNEEKTSGRPFVLFCFVHRVSATLHTAGQLALRLLYDSKVSASHLT